MIANHITNSGTTSKKFSAMPEIPRARQISPRRGDYALNNLLWLALITAFAFLVMGYHPGLEDDSFYLAAIKRNLNPALFPHDADFFRLQFQATIFDKLIAWSVRLAHLPLMWVVLLWQIVAIFVLLHGCWRIARRCFVRPEAHWAATALIATLLTMPIGGIAINLADQYLHPRTLATAAILAAVVEVIDGSLWLGGVLLAVAFAIHAIMASFGISFCIFLFWTLNKRDRVQASVAALLIPLGWLFEPASSAWRQAASTRGFYFLGRWAWYEWLGVFGRTGSGERPRQYRWPWRRNCSETGQCPWRSSRNPDRAPSRSGQFVVRRGSRRASAAALHRSTEDNPPGAGYR